MHCQYCYKLFKHAGNYHLYLRHLYPNLPMTFPSHNPLMDVQELSVATSYKHGHSYSLGVVCCVKRCKGTIRTTSTGSKSKLGVLNSAATENDVLSLQEPILATVEPQQHFLASEYAAGKVIHISIFQHIWCPQYNPLALFEYVYKYKLAWFFHQSKTSLKAMDSFIKNSVYKDCSNSVRFKSCYT